MLKTSPKMVLMAVGVFALIGLSQIALETLVEARAGGGGTGGFRGSRTYRAPSRPTQPPSSQPRREAAPPSQQPTPFAPQSGGFMRGLGTAILGGFLGSMLFSGLANAGIGGFGGSGIGLVEILLFGGLAYFLFRKFRGPALATGYGPMQYQNGGYAVPNAAPVSESPASDEVDLRSLTMMDRTFQPDQFLKSAQALFFKIQGAWNKQDTTALRSLCGSELLQTWEQELTNLRARRQKNVMENIALHSSEITEAWTESGQDYITVRLQANLLDYTVDERTGLVVSGSNSEPVEFEEYWTFSRPVGPNQWKLSAVQQA